jgi:ERCC4-type nuclease
MTTTTRKPRRKPGEPETLPFTVAVDTREQNAFTFTGMVADKGHPLIVPTLLTTLTTGDYSIVGMESLVCVERKSASDLFSTLASGRERFEAEHIRMSEYKTAVVLIEADWATILNHPPYPSRLNPLTVYRTALSWMVKYHVQWLAVPGRRFAELTCFQILKKFYDAEQERLKGEI